MLGVRPRGDEWYGGENGYDNATCDGDIPSTIGDAMLRGQNASEYVPVLFFFDPADLARVAEGSAAPSEPHPYARLELGATLFNTGRAPDVKSLAIDPATKTLYLFESSAGRFGAGAIHVWHYDGVDCP